MKFHVAISRNFGADKAAESLIREIKKVFGETKIDLVLMFFSPDYCEELQALTKLLWKSLEPQVMLGCMGDGVIGESEEFEETPVITLWAASLPNVIMVPMHLVFSENNESYVITGWPNELSLVHERPTFILLADPFSTPVDKALSHIEHYCPGAPAIGGLASGGSDLGENRMIFNDSIRTEGLVGIAMWGEVSIRMLVSQGCNPIGERYVVTKSERNIIYELGGMPTIERLQGILSNMAPERSQEVAMALQVGIAFDEQQEQLNRGDFLIRELLGADQQSGGLAISDIVEEGQTIQFHLRDAKAASEELNLLLAKDRMDHQHEVPQGSLLFTCSGRGRRFFSEPNHDINVLRRQTGDIPIAGFFAAGEIGPVGRKNFIHAYTASVALFAKFL